MESKNSKLMKNLQYVGLFLFAALLVSCEKEFLEPEPETAITSDTYFLNDEQIESGIIGMYDAIQGVNSNDFDDNFGIQREFYVTEMRSDNTRTKSQEGEAAEFETFAINANNGTVANYYASFYAAIARANLVLDNIGNASPEMASAFEGEAKFVRAYAYFNLVRLFGDIPLITESVGPRDERLFSRVATSTIYEVIITDLETAIENLDNSSKFRGSRAAAQGLLAKVHLTLGNYTSAQSLCESIMTSGEFSLQADLREVFYNEGNDEVLFAIGFTSDNGNESQNYSAEMLNSVGRTVGVNYVTDEAREALDALGGERTQYSYRQDVAQPTQYQVVKYLPNGDANLGIDPTSTDPTSAGNDWIVLRYADVLLMHVEAIMAGSQETTVPAALSSFQAIRDRAGLTDPVTSITKQELLDERRVELAFENHRFFDLIRFGVAQEVLTAFSNDNGYTFSASDLLLPIPQREINLSNGGLTQNPGY
jgi:hypothetical protein